MAGEEGAAAAKDQAVFYFLMMVAWVLTFNYFYIMLCLSTNATLTITRNIVT